MDESFRFLWGGSCVTLHTLRLPLCFVCLLLISYPFFCCSFVSYHPLLVLRQESLARSRMIHALFYPFKRPLSDFVCFQGNLLRLLLRLLMLFLGPGRGGCLSLFLCLLG